MPERIRGQETTVNIVQSGEILSGSFAQVLSFRWNPRADLTDTSFLGEDTDEPDIQHHGYDFSFSIQQRDNTAVASYMRVVTTQANNLPNERITIVFTKRYRDPSVPAVTLSFTPALIKLDSEEFGGRKEYITNAFSGKSRYMIQR
jgi:hypothetical protein